MPDITLRTKNRAVNIYNEYEYLAELEDEQQRIEKLNIMRMADAQVGALLNALKLPIRRINWEVVDGVEKHRDFIKKNLMEELETPFKDFIRLCLTFMDFGYSLFEKVFRFEESDGYYHWQDFVFLPQATIREIIGNKNGSLKKIIQEAPSDMEKGEALGDEIHISAQYLIHFINNKEGDLYGTAILRNAYGNWKIKDQLMLIDAIKHDRYGVGTPYMKLKVGYKKDDLKVAEETLTKFRSHEYAYMIIPPGVEEFGVMGQNTEGKDTDIIKSIQYHDESMTKSILAQFLDLGTSESGNRALGTAFIKFFLMSLNSYVKLIESVFNENVIKQLVQANWGDQEEYPKLQGDEISFTDIIDIADAVKNLIDGGLLTPTRDDQNELRRQIGFEQLEDEEQEETQGSEKFSEKWQQFRDLKGLESDINFQQYNDKLDTMKKQFIREMKVPRDKQIKAMTYDMVKKGKTIKNVLPRYRDVYEKIIMDYQMKAFELGSKQVNAEKKAQLSRAGVPENKMVFVEFEDLPEETKRIFKENADAGAQIITSRTAAVIADQKIQYQRQGLTENQIQAKILNDFLGTGDKVIGIEYGRAVTAWGMGRKNTADEDEAIQGGFYSAILDGNTCSVCAQADFIYNAGHDQPFKLEELPPAPNPDCLGYFGQNACRCIHVYQIFIETGEDIPLERAG